MHTFFRCKPSCSEVQPPSYADLLLLLLMVNKPNISVERILPDKQLIEECIQKFDHF